MTDRYYLERPIREGETTLSGSEAHHLLHVMRASPGDLVTLFDGSGREHSAQVVRVGRSDVHLRILRSDTVDRELPIDLTLAVSLPKGERQKWLVEKAVELGVRRLVPIRAARSVAQPAEQALTRLRRGAIEASKQCGRNRLLTIEEPQEWAAFVPSVADVENRLLAHPARLGMPEASPVGPSAVVAIGPEGGWTQEEVSLALAAGWTLVDMGPRILRVETAAIYLVALVIARTGA